MTRCRCCGATIDAAVLVAAFVGVSPLSCADSPWIGTVTAATDYVFRDVSQTHGRAALQGGV